MDLEDYAIIHEIVDQVQDTSGFFILFRVIHGPKDRVTPFDLRAQNLGVNVKFST